MVTKNAALIGLILMMGTLSPGSSSAQVKVTTFQLWSWIPAYEQQYFDRAATEFNKEHPRTPVALQYKAVPFSELHDRIIKNLNYQANLPDIVAIEFRQWPYYQADDPDSFLVDLSGIYNQYASSLFPNTGYEYVYHKKHYALGWQSSPLILAYQQDALDKAGVTYPIKTWDDFKKAAVKVHAAGKTLSLLELGDPQIFYSIFLQRGGLLYDADGHFVFPKYVKEAKDVFRLLKYLHDNAGLGKRKVNSFVAGKYNKEFETHHIMGIMGGDWILMMVKQEFPQEKGQWRIQPAPVWPKGEGHQGVSFGGTGYALLQKKSRTPQQQALLKEFLSFATVSFHMQALYFKRTNLQMTNKTLFNRVYAITFADPFLGGQKTLLDLRDELKDLAPRYIFPGFNTFLNRLSGIQKEYLNGSISLDQAIARLSKKPG